VNSRIVLTWQAYLLFSVISVLAVPLALVDQLSPRNFFYFLGIGLGLTVATGLLLLPYIHFSKAWLSNSSRQKQEVLSVLVIGLTGVLRGILLHYLIVWFGFTEPINIWTRIATSTTTTLLWFTAIAIFVTSRTSFKADYEAILRKTIVETSEKLNLVDLDSLPASLENELLEIEKVLGTAFGKDLPSSSRDSLNVAAAHIKHLIEEKIRPLSHRLWIESAAETPRVNIGPSLLASIKYLNLPTLPTLIFLALSTILNVSVTVGLNQGIFATVVILVEVFCMLTLFQNKVSYRTNGKLALNGLLLLVPGLVLSLTFYLSNKFLFNKDFGSLNLIYVVIFLFIALLVSSFQLVNRDREQLIFMIERELTTVGWRSSLKEKYLNKKAASYLHNLLQSELLAITKQIEISSDDLDSVNSLKDLEILLDRLNRPIKDDFQKFLNNPIERLNRLQNAWKGIADVNITIPTQALEDQNRNILLVQIVEEAIANAVRHAGATQVKVTAEMLPDTRVCFSVINDGVSSKEESIGLGSAWLDHHAPNSWARKKLEKGSELIFTL
jgi:hypothetical protein